jgi:hypothetical protein
MAIASHITKITAITQETIHNVIILDVKSNVALLPMHGKLVK